MQATDAQRVIICILRNTPNGIGRTKLYKAFYLSHLSYADTSLGVLTNWPIAHMPHGPGINDGWKLLDPLTEHGYIEHLTQMAGIYNEHLYRWTGKELSGNELSPLAQNVIRRITEYVLPMTAAEISNLTHEHSRSWREGKSGEILDLYTDLIDDEEFDRRNAQFDQLDTKLAAALRERSDESTGTRSEEDSTSKCQETGS
jgi:hypothetical protein